MKYPLRNLVYERIKEEGNVLDVDLLNYLNKNSQNVQMAELNRVLLQLEILGLITVRWVGKDRRRIEVVEKPATTKESAASA